MHKNDEQIAIYDRFVLLLVMINVVAIRSGFITNPKWYKISFIGIPLLAILIITSRKRTIKL